ncbi:MAG: GAF domain-containing protein [Chloroflexota bacterium]|nr:GAF domain-containing protein [Chloroflexota bacterium]
MGGAKDLERELAESQAREAALAEVLGVMRRTPADLNTVLETVLDRAARLCGAERASIHLLDGQVYRTAAFWGPRNAEYERVAYHTTRTPGRETLIGRTALDRAVIHIPDVLADPEYTATDLQRLGGYRTMLGVPLFRGDLVAGVFVLTRNDVRPFSDREIALVCAFADQAVVAIENARLLKGTTDALERQTAVSEVLKEMSRSAFDLDRVLESVAMNAVRLCAADNGSIARLEGDGWRLVANAGDFDREGLEKNWGKQPIEPDRRSLTGRVLMDRRTTTIVDVLADSEYDAGAGLFNVRSIIGVPLTRGHEIVGVLILRRNEPKPFTPEEVHLLETFADQASIAIENVRLFDETKESLEQQTAIAEVLGAISRSAFDLDLVLTTIVENAVRLTDAANGTIMGIEGPVARWLVTTEPESDGRVSGPLEPNRRSLTGRVLLERRTVQIEDIGADPEYDLTGYFGPACTMLGVPLHLRSDLVGILIVRRRDVRAFTADQIRIAETFADQAAIAMNNVRLFNETKESLDRQTATSEILRVMASSPTEVQPVLDAIAENAARVCGASDAHVYRVEGEVLKQWAHFGPIPGLAPGESLPLSRGSVIGRCILDRRAIHTKDALDLDPAEYPISVQLRRRWGYRTALAVPLIRHGVGIGGIAIRRMEVQPFAPKQIELLETFADQAAIAIANVELFQTVERQRKELSRFLSPQVAALITSDQGANLLEGHRRQITVVFCDLRGFTHFAETAEPEEVLGVLRDYHRAMGELVVEHQGTLEHFAGDGMMVFFNDPLPVEHHELQAVRMACAMREGFEEMARAWQKRGYELGFGVGIATGYATLGRIGFEGRYDYGAVGNVVILAQRLSAEAKAGQILLSQRVHAAVESDAETTAIGELALKGFTRPVPAFSAESVKAPTAARP